jgi:hypothetical protein
MAKNPVFHGEFAKLRLKDWRDAVAFFLHPTPRHTRFRLARSATATRPEEVGATPLQVNVLP